MSTISPIKVDEDKPLERRVKSLYFFLITANLIAWVWAIFEFHYHSALIGTALLAYSFGVRHALDADHIAAIDNVTRKLIQDGKSSVTVGLFFAIGHSSVVILASVAIALMAKTFMPYLAVLQVYGGIISTITSSVFLSIIGLFNFVLLMDIYKSAKRHEKTGGTDYIEPPASKGHILARIFQPLFKNIHSSWQMIPLGFLFGLGFETATEVAVLSTSVIHSVQGMKFALILLFPILFAVGMLTVDSADGLLMLKVYGWAFVKPVRKLYYNFAITITSTILAFLIAGVSVSSLIKEHFQFEGMLWNLIERMQAHYSLIGLLVVAIFSISFLGSEIFFKKQNLKMLKTTI